MRNNNLNKPIFKEGELVFYRKTINIPSYIDENGGEYGTIIEMVVQNTISYILYDENNSSILYIFEDGDKIYERSISRNSETLIDNLPDIYSFMCHEYVLILV